VMTPDKQGQLLKEAANSSNQMAAVTQMKTHNTTGGSGSAKHNDSNLKDNYQFRTPSSVDKKIKVNPFNASLGSG